LRVLERRLALHDARARLLRDLRVLPPGLSSSRGQLGGTPAGDGAPAPPPHPSPRPHFDGRLELQRDLPDLRPRLRHALGAPQAMTSARLAEFVAAQDAVYEDVRR